MLNIGRAKIFIYWVFPFIYFVTSSIAYAQVSPNFDDLLDGLDDALTQSDTPEVYNSVDASVNPRIAVICGYIENQKVELIQEILLDDQHNLLEKQHGDHHSFVNFFSTFKCPQSTYWGLSRGGNYNNQFTLLELSMLCSKNLGLKTVSSFFVKLETMPTPDRYSVFRSNSYHGETIVKFAEGLVQNYMSELDASGAKITLYEREPTLKKLKNIRDRLKELELQTNQELLIIYD